MALRVGWHAGNVHAIDEVDWRIMGLVRPDLFVYIPFEGIGLKQLRAVRQLAPQGEAVVRPYYVPQEYSLAAVDRYIDDCRRALDEALQVWPAGSLHLKPWNEPNQPRWAQWEGFGSHVDDQRHYNEGFCRLADRIRAHAPGVRLHVLSLTDYHDVRCPGDPADVPYWLHGWDGTGATALTADAIRAADVIGCHVYLHRRGEQGETAWTTNITDEFYGARYRKIRELWPDKVCYITEAGYPSPGFWPSKAGERIALWLRMVAQDPMVGGVALWMLGTGMGHNGHWRDGNAPAAAVYDVARWQDGSPPISQPDPGSGLPELTHAYLASTRQHRLRLNPVAALKNAIEQAGQYCGGNEFDATPAGARQYGFDPRTNRWYLWEWTASGGVRTVWAEDAV